MSFGLETHTGYSGDALYFWANPRRYREGIAWLFPVGNGSRVGLGSYAGSSKLKGPLERFVDDLSAAPTAYHGTFFPSRLRQATTGKVFVVGDAAGQCLPLTAEGIRPALFFGLACGGIIQRVLEGALTLEEGLEAYRRGSSGTAGPIASFGPRNGWRCPLPRLGSVPWPPSRLIRA